MSLKKGCVGLVIMDLEDWMGYLPAFFEPIWISSLSLYNPEIK
jgi:hypothetical protein